MPDLYLAYEAARFAQQAGVPLIVDARDQWPDVFLEVVPDWLRGLARFVLRRDFHRLKKLLQAATGIVASMDAILAWALERAGRARRDRDRVFYLGATQEKGGVAERAPAPAAAAQNGGQNHVITVVFTGTFGRYYRPSVLVRAVKHLNGDPIWRDRIRCIIGGDGDYSDEVRREAEGEPNVVLTGWLDTTAMRTLLAEATLGVIPLVGTIEAFPNKAYTYLSAGLPILSSVGGEFRQVMETRGFGRHFEPNDAVALALLLQECWTDQPAVREMRARAVEAFAREFDARVIYRSYAEYVEDIATERPSSSSTPAIRRAAWPSP
jgi:glycosyltransferase involved in cell wall biosynthesis